MINAISKDQLLFSGSEQSTAADFVLEFLSHINVDKIFGVPGGAIEPLFDAVARFNRRNDVSLSPGCNPKVKPSIQLITSRHEAGAVFMADGYARETGHLAVCCATTGPGSTNMITGIASAYMDKTPMLILTPQTSMSNFGRQDLQDSSDDAISIVTMLSRCTRYNSMVTHIDQLKYKLMKAVKTAFIYPAGPVHLSIPIDIWTQMVDADIPDGSAGFKKRGNEGYDQESYEALCKLVVGGKKLLFLLGENSLPYSKSIVACAELLAADIVTTPTAKGCIQANHPLYKGVLGFAGHQQAEDILTDEHLDYVVAIGSNLNPFETAGLCDNMTVVEKMLYINHSVTDGMVCESAGIQLYGSLKKIFHDLEAYLIKRQVIDSYVGMEQSDSRFNVARYKSVKQGASDKNIASLTHVDQPERSALVKPQYLMGKLPAMFPLATRFHVDAGNSWAWATHYLHLNSVSNYHIAMGFGSMGWAIGAAVGAASAQSDAPVVCISGDGSYLMSGQELTVAVQQQLSVIFVILNDSAYGMVRHGQRIGGAEQIGFELPSVDFAMIARAMGARGMTVRNAQELDELDVASLHESNGPVLLDVYIDPEEVPPMASRLKELGRG